MTVSEIIVLARKHVGNGAAMESSARLCLKDAVEQFDAGNFKGAERWAIKSLMHSVGILHADFVRATTVSYRGFEIRWNVSSVSAPWELRRNGVRLFVGASVEGCKRAAADFGAAA